MDDTGQRHNTMEEVREARKKRNEDLDEDFYDSFKDVKAVLTSQL